MILLKYMEVIKIPEEIKHQHLTKAENPDSITIGAPASGGAIKIYGDFSHPDDFKKKIEEAFIIRKLAQEKMKQ
jgi:hypothetical protein